jgi:hypothetical protein
MAIVQRIASVYSRTVDFFPDREWLTACGSMVSVMSLSFYMASFQVPRLKFRLRLSIMWRNNLANSIFLTADLPTWQIALENDTVPRFEFSSVLERPLLLSVPCFQSCCKGASVPGLFGSEQGDATPA